MHFTEPVLQLVKESSTSALSSLRYPQEEHRPSSPINTDPNIERLFMKKRPRSPKRHKKISVNQRPFSASNLNQAPSHYVQLLKSPYMQKTVPSPKVLNKLLRPQSGGARLGWGLHLYIENEEHFSHVWGADYSLVPRQFFFCFFFFINFLMKKLWWLFTLHNEKMLHLTKNN